MTKHSIAALCALTLAGLGYAPASHAEDSLVPTNLTTPSADDGKDVKESKELKQQCKESCISGDLGVTMPTQYMSRGLMLENQGVIAQPYLDLYFKLYEGTGFINKVVFNFSLWSSIHSHVQPTTAGTFDATARNWYEFDWTPGIAVTFAKNFTATLSYFEFDSPASSFDTARSINLNIAYDDTDLLGKFALHPHVTVLSELNAPGFAGLQGHGWYYEIGLAPSYTAGPVTFTVPITVGLGDGKRFYGDEAFGYFATGLQISVPLSFIPECYGKWTFSGGYTWYLLGDNVADATATGHESQHVLQGAIGLTF